MPINTITLLPTPVPSRADPLNFATRADAFLGALPTFGTELNSFATSANALALEVENNKTEAQTILDETIIVQETVQDLYDSSIAIANFKGLWSTLTGALARPATVYHNSAYWILLVDLANVASSTPSTGNSNWLKVSFLASDINYTDTTTVLGASTVQQAIEKLYQRDGGLENILINPEFMVDQVYNGGVISIPVSTNVKYLVDQWVGLSKVSAITAQRIAGIADREFSLRFTGSASNTGLTLGQRIEANRCTTLKNQTVTASLKCKASISRVVTWTVSYANVADNFVNQTQIATGTFNVTTTTTDFSFSFNAGANAGNGLSISFSTTGLLAGATIDFDQIQLVKSATPTFFRGRPLTLELILCQRYLESGYAYLRGVHTSNGGTIATQATFKVRKRATPTITETFGSTNGTPYVSTATPDNFIFGVTVGSTITAYVFGDWTADARL